MKSELIAQAEAIYRSGSRNRKIKDFDGEIDLNTYLLNTFHVGQYFFFIYYLPEQKMEYVSGGVRDVLGAEPEHFNLQYIVEKMHPDDVPNFLVFEKTLVEFLAGLDPAKLSKYKVRYDYRLQDTDGNYKRILHQLMTLQSDKDGAVIRTFGVFTDISQYKDDLSMQLNVIGTDGEPSFFDIKEDCSFTNTASPFSDRERRILGCLAEGKRSDEIAAELGISKHTVDNHRKNILKKSGCSTSADAVRLAIERVWI